MTALNVRLRRPQLRRKVAIAALLLVPLCAAYGWVAVGRPAPRGPRTIISDRPLVLSSAAATAGDLRASVLGANVVIIVLDAARADHTGCYGYSRETTPNIDRLSAESVVFERHYAEFPQTKTSTVSLFTSEHADTHLAIEMRDAVSGCFTLQQGLKQADFTTVYFTSNSWASPSSGLSRGLDEIYSPAGPGGIEDAPDGTARHRISRKAPDLMKEFSKWLAGRQGDRFFAYLHFLPPHYPYEAPAEIERLFAGKPPPNYRHGRLPFKGVDNTGGPKDHQHLGPAIVNKYDANLRYGDALVGQVVADLRARGLLDQTLLIITADHGETLGEHGYKWHPSCPFEEALHIPLLVRFPGGRVVGRVSALTQTIDLLPTIYDLLRLPVPRELVQGSSLLPLLSGEKTAQHQYLFSRTGGSPACYIVRDLRYSLLLFEGGTMRALYDLEADPWQRRNLIAEDPARADRMAGAFRQFAATQRAEPLQFVDAGFQPTRRQGKKTTLTDEAKKELEALGYLK